MRPLLDDPGFEMLHSLEGVLDELVNFAVRQRDSAARTAVLDALVDEMTCADDLTHPEPVGMRSDPVGV